MSKHLINTYKTQELFGQAAAHAMSAFSLAKHLHLISDHNPKWQEDAEENCKMITQIKTHLVEMFQYYSAFATECGRPLESEHNEKKPLMINVGDWTKVNAAHTMLSSIMRSVLADVEGNRQTDFSRASLLTYEKCDEVDANIRKTNMDTAFEKVENDIADVKLITWYFGGYRSEEAFPKLKEKFLQNSKSR